MPSIGKITSLNIPTGPGVRVDSGVYGGYEITPYYDSMIAKLICWGEDRGEAILRMRRALEEYTIMGVKHNIPFHQNLMNSFSFIAGMFDTKFVEERFSMTTYEEAPQRRRTGNRRDCRDLIRPPPAAACQPSGDTRRTRYQQLEMGRTLGEDAPLMKYVTTDQRQAFEIEILADGSISVNGKKREVDFRALGPAHVLDYLAEQFRTN